MKVSWYSILKCTDEGEVDKNKVKVESFVQGSWQIQKSSNHENNEKLQREMQQRARVWEIEDS